MAAAVHVAPWEQMEGVLQVVAVAGTTKQHQELVEVVIVLLEEKAELEVKVILIVMVVVAQVPYWLMVLVVAVDIHIVLTDKVRFGVLAEVEVLLEVAQLLAVVVVQQQF